jgi:hypothetical protein
MLMKSRKSLVSIIVIGVASFIVLSLVVLMIEEFSVWGKPKPARDQMVEIRQRVARMSDVTIVSFVDRSWRENQEVFLEMQVKNKGRLKLFNATLASFDGTGNLFLVAIRDCEVRPWLNPRLDSRLSDLKITTVQELILNYDEIYSRMQANSQPNLAGCVKVK